MWEPNAWIYFSLGCAAFLGCAYLQLCPVVVWGDGGSRCAFCQRVHGVAGSRLLFLLAVSPRVSDPCVLFSASMGWECVCVGLLKFWLCMRS